MVTHLGYEHLHRRDDTRVSRDGLPNVGGLREETGLVAVSVSGGTRTSEGVAGPGLLRLPAAEAGRLVGERLAVYGDQPPRDGHL